MLGFFRRARSRSHVAASPKRVSLRLEALEWRDQPSDVPLGNPPPGSVVFYGDGDGAPVNAAPVITQFAAVEIVNGLYHITGKVIDETPGGLVVTFGGDTSAFGQTATTAADGTFSKIWQFGVDGTDCGFLTATTKDAQNVPSESVQVWVDPTPT